MKLLSKEEVVGKYRQLLNKYYEEDHSSHIWIDELPPFLCRALILDQKVALATESVESAFAGHNEARLVDLGGLKVSVGEFSDELISSLPIDGHLALSVPGLSEWNVNALTLLSSLSNDAYATTKDWTSLFVWLAPDEDNPPDNVLTSVAIPSLPHCSFFSVKALRHIPARHVFDGASLYALAENIYHESLHQQLNASLIFDEKTKVFSEESKLNKVHIPWRDVHWELDRVLHAAWVYSGLQLFRENALESSLLEDHEKKFLKGAYNESKPRLELLLLELDAAIPNVSDESKGIIEWFYYNKPNKSMQRTV